MNVIPNLEPDALARLCRLGGGKFAGEMIDLFLDYGAKKVAEARQAQTAGDLSGVAGAAHPLKSSAGNVGAARVQTLATQLEAAARSDEAGVAAAHLTELEAAFAAAREELLAAKLSLADTPAPPRP